MATLRLRTEHQEQLNNLQKSQRPRLVKGRKNLGLVIAVLNQFIAARKTETTSRDIADTCSTPSWTNSTIWSQSRSPSPISIRLWTP